MNILHKTASLLVLVATLMAMNVHLGIAQYAAWATMIYDYQASEGSLSKAVEMTFDGEHPCDLCHVVRRGMDSEAQEDEAVLPNTQIKLLLTDRKGITVEAADLSYLLSLNNFEFIPETYIDIPEPPPREVCQLS